MSGRTVRAIRRSALLLTRGASYLLIWAGLVLLAAASVIRHYWGPISVGQMKMNLVSVQTDGGGGSIVWVAVVVIGVLPVLVTASFAADAVHDTYLDVSDAGHGVAWVNGFCVGRYWDIGPQQTLYVPAPVVRTGRNEVLLLELEKAPASLALSARPVFGSAPAAP